LFAVWASLLIMNLAREFITSSAMIHLILYSTLKY